MKRRLVVLAFIVLAVTTVGAAQMDGLNDAVDRYNQNSDKLPRIVNTLVGEQKVNVIINMSDGSQETFAVTMDGLDMQMQNETFANYTVRVTTTQEALTAVMESEKPLDELSSRRKAGDIAYTTNGLFNQIRMSLVDLVV